MKSIKPGDAGYLLLRILLGGLIAYHGYGLMISFSEKVNVFSDPIGIGRRPSLLLAIFSEFICGIFIIIGLRVRLTAIPVLITMAVAFFLVHANDSFSIKEPAFAYLGLDSLNLKMEKLLRIGH